MFPLRVNDAVLSMRAMAGPTVVVRIELPNGVPMLGGGTVGAGEEVGVGLGVPGVASGLTPAAGLAMLAGLAGAAGTAGALGLAGASVDGAGTTGAAGAAGAAGLAGVAGVDDLLAGPLVIAPVPACVEASARPGAVRVATATPITVTPRPVTTGLR